MVWFNAFISGLAAVRSGPGRSPVGIAAFALALGGMIAMLAGALMRGAQPVRSNCVPVIIAHNTLRITGHFHATVVGGTRSSAARRSRSWR